MVSKVPDTLNPSIPLHAQTTPTYPRYRRQKNNLPTASALGVPLGIRVAGVLQDV